MTDSTSPPFRAEAFDPRSLDERRCALLNAFYDAMHMEEEPDDPPMPHDERIRTWRSRPAFVEAWWWMVPNAAGTAVVAVGTVDWLKTAENEHLAEFYIQVGAEHRRRGIGSHLLSLIADTAAHASRRLLIGATSDRIPAGGAFMERIGASKGLETHINQLVLAELNHDAVRRWLADAQALASEFELNFWLGAFPENDLAAIADLQQVMNGAPRGDLEIEDLHYTPDFLRQQEQSLTAAGVERWAVSVRERATGAFAGISEVYWHPGRPTILQQGDTGVFPKYRNHGLGRWLKAAMLDRILHERPQVEVIRTNNADSNAPMLRINTELGFRPYMARTVWQVETDRVRRYLVASGPAPTDA